jgi:hypothetical protein
MVARSKRMVLSFVKVASYTLENQDVRYLN